MQSCLTGDVLYSEGDVGEELYFVVKGSVVLAREGRTTHVLPAYSHFGGDALVAGTGGRDHGATAAEQCELEFISLEATQRILRCLAEPRRSTMRSALVVIGEGLPRRAKSGPGEKRTQSCAVLPEDETKEELSDSQLVLQWDRRRQTRLGSISFATDSPGEIVKV